MSIHTTIYATVKVGHSFRLVAHSSRGLDWFQIQGHPGLMVFAEEGHPEAHRLHAAVAAFNAVMDAKEEA